MNETSIKKNILINTFYQVLTMIIPFITTPYISRVIGAGGVGIYSFTTSIQTYFSMFAALGTVSYGAREIARVRNDKKQRSKLFFEIELLTCITTFICLILWGIFIIISDNYKLYYIILTMNLFNTLFDISWFYTGLEQFKYTVTQNSIFKILGVILLFAFVKETDDLALYIGIMSLTTLLGTMSMWIYLPKFISKISLKNIKILHHFRETLIYFIPTIATSIYTVLDKTLIGLITKDEEQNGFYEQATKVINMTKAITFTSVNAVLGSRISYLFVENKLNEIRNKINISINYICFIGFGVMFGLIGVSENFVPIFFGEGYTPVITLIQLLSPIVIIVGISNCLGSQYYNPAGLRAKSAKYIIIGSFINFVLNLVLIPRFESYGAIIATLIAETTISMLYLKNCQGFLSIMKIINYSWKKIIDGIVMLFIVVLLNYFNYNNFIKLLIQICVGIITYIIVLWILKDSFINFVYEKVKDLNFIKKIKNMKVLQ